ncbi:MAG: hypothetical protein ACRD10_14875 [Terriglobia bacterium]
MTVPKLTKKIALMGILLAIEAATAICSGQPSLPDGPTVSVVVTVTGSGAQAPGVADKANVLVYQNHQRRPITSWVRATGQPAPLELSLLVDESLGPAFNTLLPDLRQFIRGLPASARVAVVYSTNSNANFVQQFTTDHGKAARALRLPLGAAAGNLSIYFAAQDLMKRWPDQSGSWRRTVLVVSDGIDTYHGASDSSPGNNADLSAAIRAFLRHGVIAYTLYASGASSASQNSFLVNNGQSCLTLLARETGGAAFFEGLKTPVSFRPFLGRMNKLFSSQYVLSFKAMPRAKAGLEPISVTSELPDVHINAPKEVWAPGR